MINLVIVGINGQMGQTIKNVAKNDNRFNLVGGISRNPQKINNDVLVSEKLNNKFKNSDLIIDFSHPDNLKDTLNFSKNNNIPLLIGTTGYNKKQEKLIQDASKKFLVKHVENTALGVNLLKDLVQKASKILGEDFDIEIIEKHHKTKLDAPSKTSLMFAKTINKTKKNNYEIKNGRKGLNLKNSKKEIGIHSIRAGNLKSEHTIIFSGENETIEFKSHVFSNKAFAIGALNLGKKLVSNK
ncbi:MAG: 4-hydroxy-tetrahydrodipicolinate reductase [Bacillota bacterium]